MLYQIRTKSPTIRKRFDNHDEGINSIDDTQDQNKMGEED